MSRVWKMSVVLGSTRYTGYQLKEEKRKTGDYMERHNNEGHQLDECDVGWNLPNSNEQTRVEVDRPIC